MKWILFLLVLLTVAVDAQVIQGRKYAPYPEVSIGLMSPQETYEALRGFMLRPESPARKGGIRIPGITHDILGQAIDADSAGNTVDEYGNPIINETPDIGAIQYRVYQPPTVTVVAVERMDTTGTMTFVLDPPNPNPYEQVISVRFTVKVVTRVVMRVYDVLGQELYVMVDWVCPPGTYRGDWNSSNYPIGIYQLKMEYLPPGLSTIQQEQLKKPIVNVLKLTHFK